MFEGDGCGDLVGDRTLFGTCDCTVGLNRPKGRVENGPFRGDVRFGLKEGNDGLSWRKEKSVVNCDQGVSEETAHYIASLMVYYRFFFCTS